eukprot:748008-Hanusia_phi.AAC.5
MAGAGGGERMQGVAGGSRQEVDKAGKTVRKEDNELVKKDMLSTLVALLANKHGTELYDRQVTMLKRICKTYSDGFLIADIHKLVQIFKHVGNCVDQGISEFVEPLCGLLDICSKPFVKQIASEEYRNFDSLSEIVQTICSFISSRIPEVQLSAAAAMVAYSTTDDGLPATISFRNQILGNSSAIENVGQVFQRGDVDKRVLLQLLQLLLELSRRNELAGQISEQNCLEYTVETLLQGFKSQLCVISVEILWNCMENVPSAAERLGTKRTADVFAQVITDVLKEGYRSQDKELRNELLLVLHYLAEKDKIHQFFIENGLLETLLTTSSASESEVRNEVKSSVLTSSSEDFEMKRTMMHTICLLSENAACMDRIKQHHSFIQGLVLHLDDRFVNHPARKKFSRQQQRQLQIECLSSLVILVPRFPDLFIQLGGLAIILQFLSEQSEESLRSGCLRLLIQCAKLPGFQEELGGKAVAMMISLVKEQAMHPFHIRQDALSVLARLCENCPPNQSIVSALDGLDALIENIEWTVEETIRVEPMSLTAVDAVWCIVCGNKENEKLFEEKGGLEALVLLLDRCPRFLQFLVVSCMCQLAENEVLLEQLRTLREPVSNKTVTHLLIRLWKEEEEHIMQEERNELEIRGFNLRREEDMKSGELVDHLTLKNLHTKIHSLLVKLGFDTVSDTLDTEERKKLLQIEKYLQAHEATLWQAFNKELAEEGIRPVTPDRRILERRVDENMAVQEDLEEKLQDMDAQHEAEEHDQLRQFFQQVHLEELARKNTVKRVSQALPTSTRTKIIVDSHKSQIFPPLIATTRGLEDKTNDGRGSRTEKKDNVEEFLRDSATSKLAASRPTSARPRSGKSVDGSQTAAGAGVNAAIALRAS